MTIDSRAFRNAMSRYATGITVITCRAPDGTPVGFTANSFVSVSLKPPLVLFCLDRQADGFSAFERAGHFAVHVLAADQGHLSSRFAEAGGAKWRDLKPRSGLADLPLLPDALATIECARAATYDGGDHLIFVGEVARLEVDESDREPLVYFGGAYRQLTP